MALYKAHTFAHNHTRTRTQSHAWTHNHTCTCKHMNTRARAHTHTNVIIMAHSFRGKFDKNSAVFMVNSAAHRGKADEIPRLTAATQLNFRGLIKS